jgi:hypothetical protein
VDAVRATGVRRRRLSSCGPALYTALALGFFLVAGSGCSGDVGELAQQPGPGAPATQATGSSAQPAQGELASDCTQSAQQAAPSPTTRLFRLTHHQYDRSIRALTGLAVEPSLDFPVDQNQAGFDRGVDLQVGEVLGQAYRASAETLAEQVVASPDAYRKVLGCDPQQGEPCARAFIAGFGRRAFRRPLSDAEQTAYLGMFVAGPTLVDGAATDFQKGVQVALQAFLQSPNFLYRTELSQQASDGWIALSGYETASRLSFLLLNEPPDDALLQAAESGRLSDPEAVAQEATRLLQTPAARDTVRDFHRQWLELASLPNKLAKDPVRYPTVTPALAPVLEQEALRFVEAVTFDDHKGYASLLTAPFAFVNQVTAPLYGVTGTAGDALQRVALDPAERAGIFTQVAFLAQSSPIHRGVFIQRRVLCNTIPDPPANVPSPAALGPTQTTRQQVDTLTSVAPCSGCHHALINPIGFGFEHYDAVGQYRSEENGLPIDASGALVGTVAGNEGRASFDDAVGASRLLAESVEARRCYVATWTRYALGREEDPSERCAIDALATKLADDTYTVTDLLVDLTRTKAFMFRAPDTMGGN